MAGVKIASVIDGIAALAPTGVSILDTNEVPEEANARRSILYPNSDFVSDMRIESQALGNTGSTAKANVIYTLNYIYLHSPAGSGRGIASELPDMVTNVVRIFDKIAEGFHVDGYAVDITPRIGSEVGIIEDATGNQFWGCFIAIDVLEFYEV